MVWFFRAGMSVVVVACALLLVPVSALARYPDDNGHHYGQLSNLVTTTDLPRGRGMRFAPA